MKASATKKSQNLAYLRPPNFASTFPSYFRNRQIDLFIIVGIPSDAGDEGSKI